MFYHNLKQYGGRASLALCHPDFEKDDHILLAVHGWLDNHASFLPLIMQTPQWPWVALDLPGHGQSSWLDAQSFYSFERYLWDLAIFIEHLPHKNIHLIGHSMGGALVSLLAGLYKDKVRSTVLIDGLGPLVANQELSCEQFRLSIHSYLHPRKPKARSCLEDLALARGKKHLISTESCRLLALHGSKHLENNLWEWSFDPRLLGLAPFQMLQSQVLQILGEVICPIILLRPDRGYPYDEEILKERIEKVSHLEIISTTGGHHFHLDDPSSTVNAMKTFYKKHHIFEGR